MIPVYDPDAAYLEQALRSVLLQDPGRELMQIEVVDDCSPKVDVGVLVEKIAGQRVKLSKTPQNLGLAGCWNTCIERSRGRWVHILHQDDWVLPEFYDRFQSLIHTAPDLNAAHARHIFADAEGHWQVLSALETRTAGELAEFARAIAVWQRLQCAAVVVKRSTYERLGGYRTDIPFVLDWEMWCRIAASGRWGYVPQTLAVYRCHPQSETVRLRRAGLTVRDQLAGGMLARANFTSTMQLQTEAAFKEAFVNYLMEDASALYLQAALKEATHLLDACWVEAMKSSRRWNWLWLRFRILTKPLRR